MTASDYLVVERLEAKVERLTTLLAASEALKSGYFAEIERLQAALKPFAEWAINVTAKPTLEDCERAHDALEPKPRPSTHERGEGHMPPGEGAAFANGAAARQPEIDRLTANCKGWYDQNVNLIEQRDKVWEENKSLRSNNERLRAENAALRTVLADTPDPHEVEHMRRALKAKP